MSVDFDNAWYDLNVRLRDLESNAGLPAALRELETHHLNSGFIADGLHQIERHTFCHPEDSTRCFHVQYNPRRARRFAGSSGNGAAAPKQVAGCFLCRDNIEWQQQGAQLGYRIESGDRAFFALTNPFPIMPSHIVIAAVEHRTQEWQLYEESGIAIAELIEDLAHLADRMPGYLGFYNGVGAGSSIPGHLHYQFVARPGDGRLFPLEVAAGSSGTGNGDAGLVQGYPVEAVVWRGQVDDVVAGAIDWTRRWIERNRSRLDQLTANFMATRASESGEMALYFVPRDRAKQRMNGFTGLAGGIEVLGEIVFLSSEEKALLDQGSVDYAILEAALATLSTPLEIG